MNLTVEDIVTSSGRYPKRATHPELTDDVLANILVTQNRVNALLKELEIAPSVLSGWRTIEVNKKAGGSPKSYHLRGMAIDLNDPQGHLKFRLIVQPSLLAKYGLWMEGHLNTPGWCHLDWGNRPERAVRIFRP